MSAEDIQGAIPTLLIVLYKYPLCYVPQLVLVVFQLQDSHFQYLSEMKEGITKLIQFQCTADYHKNYFNTYSKVFLKI